MERDAPFVLRVSEIIRGTGDGVAFVASSGVQTDVISSGTDVLLALVNIYKLNFNLRLAC